MKRTGLWAVLLVVMLLALAAGALAQEQLSLTASLDAKDATLTTLYVKSGSFKVDYTGTWSIEQTAGEKEGAKLALKATADHGADLVLNEATKAGKYAFTVQAVDAKVSWSIDLEVVDTKAYATDFAYDKAEYALESGKWLDIAAPALLPEGGKPLPGAQMTIGEDEAFSKLKKAGKAGLYFEADGRIRVWAGEAGEYTLTVTYAYTSEAKATHALKLTVAGDPQQAETLFEITPVKREITLAYREAPITRELTKISLYDAQAFAKDDLQWNVEQTDGPVVDAVLAEEAADGGVLRLVNQKLEAANYTFRVKLRNATKKLNAYCDITVHVVKGDTLPTSLSYAAGGKLTVKVGEAATLTPTLGPAGAVVPEDSVYAMAQTEGLTITQDAKSGKHGVKADKAGVYQMKATLSMYDGSATLSTAFSLIAVPEGGTEEDALPKSLEVTLDKEAATIAAGEKDKELSSIAIANKDAMPQDATYQYKVEYLSGQDIAELAIKGDKVVVAAVKLAAGSAQYKVTAACANYPTVNPGEKVLSVTVSGGTVLVSQISLNKQGSEVKPLELEEGKKLTLKATVSPKAAKNKKLTWTSSDPTVATVSAKGQVKAVKASDKPVVITAAAQDGGGAKAELHLRVTPVKVSKISMKKAKVSINRDATVKLEVKYAPAKASEVYKKVRWQSEDEKIAAVDPVTGVVTGVAQGKVKVFAYALKIDGTPDMTINTRCTVTVKGKKADGIKFSQDSWTGKEKLGYKLDARSLLALDPADADVTITWKSGKKKIASVDKEGLVTFNGYGTVKLTAQVKGTKLKASIQLTLSAPNAEPEKPGEPETPAEPEKPGEAETPAEPEKPGVPETPQPETPAV